jgi:hypothetical protein
MVWPLRSEVACRGHKVVVFVLDEFDLFARKPRQTLLYNLLDAMQAADMQVCRILPSRVRPEGVTPPPRSQNAGFGDDRSLTVPHEQMGSSVAFFF